jgi:hypothetical protein
MRIEIFDSMDAERRAPAGGRIAEGGSRVSPFRSVPALAALLSACLAMPSIAQPASAPSPQDPAVSFSLDSLQRVISRRILNDADKKDIRACEREKSQFLKQCRASDSATASVDKKLNEAKSTGANPNDPAIQALLEKKFALEKACDDAFSALARGKQCLAGEDKRRVALEKALKQDKQYQSMLKKAQPPGPEPL